MDVSFKTAQFLKEKGFDWDCKKYYQDSERAGSFEINSINNKLIDELHAEDKYCVIYFAVPTLAEAQKWVREVHGIHVYCVPNVHFIEKDFENYSFCFLNGTRIVEDDGTYSRYEDCLDAGLKYVLDYEMEYC